MKRTRKRKREPGLQVHFADGDVLPVVVPASREPTVIRLSKAKNGAWIVNAPKHVRIIKQDRRPGK
jgi:hypothetical protein